MNDEKGMTAPVASAVHKESLSSRGALAKGFHYVGADAEQSLNENNISISEESSDFNTDQQKKLDKIVQEIERMRDPAFLNTVTMNELYDNYYPSKPPVIDGLLYTGLYLLAGAPKVGKSFLVAQIAYHVSIGERLFGYNVRQGGVLYLALEDDYQRLQRRMSRMFGETGTDHLNFAIHALQVDTGLDIQLENYLHEHSDTKLIIIDTLQKIRAEAGESYSYANDYDVVGRLKQFADARGLCILLVHHTRKQQADDKFDKISGTTGLLGAADGALLLQKEKRTGLDATLDVVGRDQPDQRLYLIRDEDRLTWHLDHTEVELWKKPPDPFLEAIAAIAKEHEGTWTGSATELTTLLREELQPNILTRRLNIKRAELKSEYRTEYRIVRNRNGTRITLNSLADLPA